MWACSGVRLALRALQVTQARTQFSQVVRPPAEQRRRLQNDWGFTDLEMRDVVNSGALELLSKILIRKPSDRDALSMHELCEHNLTLMYESKLGSMEARPSVSIPPDEIKRPVYSRQRHPRSGDALVTMLKERQPTLEFAAVEPTSQVMPKGRNFH